MKKYFMTIGKIGAILLVGFILNVDPQLFADITFGQNIRVDDTGTANIIQGYPSIAIDKDGNIYVVWQDRRDSITNSNIYFAKSTDGGNTFGANIRVNDSNLSNTYEGTPSIVVDIYGNIYIVWKDKRNGNWDIYFAKSTDGGNTFGTNIRVDDTGTLYSSQGPPSIAIDMDGNIYVVWADERNGFGNSDIYFSKSVDGGNTFETNVRVDDTGTSISNQIGPSIAVDANGNIYVVWADNRRHRVFYDIYFAKSTDGGNTFETNVRVDDTGSLEVTHVGPCIAVDAIGNIYVAWTDSREGWYASTSNVYLAKSINGGDSFGTSIKVNDTNSPSTGPSIVMDKNGNIYVVWHHAPLDVPNFMYFNIYFTESTNGGASFESSIRIDDAGQLINQWYPKIAVDTNRNTYVTWMDDRNENWDIYFAKGVQSIPATIAINPETINLKSKGQDIACHIELPAEYDIEDIDIYTVVIESNTSSVLAEIFPTEVGNIDKDEIPDLMVKFNRDSVNQILSPGNIELTVKGSLLDGTNFEGSYIVNVLDKEE